MNPLLAQLPGLILKSLAEWAIQRSAGGLVSRLRRRGLAPVARRLAVALDSYSLMRIRPHAFTIRGLGRIPKSEVAEILQLWAGGINGILVVGSAGVGKSGVAHRVASSLRSGGSPVLFLDCSELSRGEAPASFLATHLSSHEDGLIDELRALGRQVTTYVIVDQLDDLAGTRLFGMAVALLKTVASLPGMRVLGVCRSFEASQESDIRHIDFAEVRVSELDLEDAKEYLERLSVDDPSSELIQLARNPLNLSLIAEIVHSSGRIGAITEEVELYEAFLKVIEDRGEMKIVADAQRLAMETLLAHLREFPLPSLLRRSTLRLVSWGLLQIIPGGRARFQHDSVQDFLGARALLPRRVPAMDIYAQFGSHYGRRLVRWLTELLDLADRHGEARFIDDLLSAKTETQYYDRAVVLDVLSNHTGPAREVAEVLSRHLQDEIYEKYFFEGLENPAWVPVLHEAGLFVHPPGRIEVEPGRFRIPWWFAGGYLARVASVHPNVVLEVASTVRSDNDQVLAHILDALVRIPPRLAAGAAFNIAEWAKSVAGFYDPHRLGRFMRDLHENGHVGEAFLILGALFEPAEPPSPETVSELSRHTYEPRSRIDGFWLKEIWSQYGNHMVELSPQMGLKVLEDQMLKTSGYERQVMGEAAMALHSLWRPAIEDHLQNTSVQELKGLLIDGLRTALDAICWESPEEGRLVLARYLASEWPILRRLALHTLRSHGGSHPDLLEAVFSSRELLDEAELHHEVYWLLADQFPALPPATATEVVNWILGGPGDAEAIATRIREREGEEDAEKKAVMYSEYWTFRRLCAIRRFLVENAQARMIELEAKFGQPDHPDFLSWHSEATWLKHATPVSAEDLKSMSVGEIVRILKEYRPPTPSFEDAREGLAEVLKVAASDDPAALAPLAKGLADPEIRPIYVYFYLLGMREVIARGERGALHLVLDLCDYAANMSDRPDEDALQHFEPGFRASQLEATHIIEACFELKEPFLDAGVIERLADLIGALSTSPDPTVEGEGREANLDPATLSLNSVRGMAMHCALSLALYVERIARSEADAVPHTPRLDNRVQALLERSLDKEREPSLAVHSVYGWHLPRLHYLDPQWVRGHLDNVFPAKQDQAVYWRAAWEAYVSFNAVYEPLFILLVHFYQRAAQELGVERPGGQLRTPVAERLAQHILFAYLHGLVDIQSNDGLVRTLYDRATDEVRGRAGFWLGKALEQFAPKVDDRPWERLYDLWIWRVNEAVDHAAERAFTDEISSYMRWLPHVPLNLAQLEVPLFQSIPFVKEGFFRLRLLEFAAKWATEHPLIAVRLLERTLPAQEWGFSTLAVESVRSILGTAASSKDEVAREVAVRVINDLGERGDFRWKEFLPEK